MASSRTCWKSPKDVNKTIQEIVTSTYKKHKRIIFNGNNYSDDWVAEAAKARPAQSAHVRGGAGLSS